MSIDWDAFRVDFNEAVKGLKDKYNITLTTGTIRYTPSSFSMPVKGLISDWDISGEEAEFKRLCNMFGKKPEDYGKTFTSNGKVLKLVGFNTRARKYPFVGEEVGTGRRYKFMKVDV